MTGAELISGERARQINREGWTPEHDDAHNIGQMADAAVCYVNAAMDPNTIPYRWPWEREWWKPSPDPVRNLVKAGALIAAEIDRLRRLRSSRSL